MSSLEELSSIYASKNFLKEGKYNNNNNLKFETRPHWENQLNQQKTESDPQQAYSSVALWFLLLDIHILVCSLLSLSMGGTYDS